MVEALLGGEKPSWAEASAKIEAKAQALGVDLYAPPPPPKEEIVASFKVATNDAGKKVIQLGMPKVAEPTITADVAAQERLFAETIMDEPAPIPADEVVWVNPPEATQPEAPLIETVTLKTPMASAKKKVTVPKRAKKRAKFRHILRQS